MIKIENITAHGFEAAVRGMRNPMNSWDKSDSFRNKNGVFIVGLNDLELMHKLVSAGSDHSKFMRMITVTCDITAPLYWWKEFDTYKVSTVRNSCSTMHKIAAKEFALDDFSHEHLICYSHDGEICRDFIDSLECLIDDLNAARELYLETKNKDFWWQIIQLLPSGYNQRSTVMLNYAVLRNMYHARKNHKLDEWHAFCDAVRVLPHSELITKDRSDGR